MKIIVLMGGDSTERDVSLVTGDKVAKALEGNGHQVIKIDPVATKEEQTKLNKTDRHWIGIQYPDIDLLPLHRGSMYLKTYWLSNAWSQIWFLTLCMAVKARTVLFKAC